MSNNLPIVVTDANFVQYAALHYDNPFPDPTEFHEDLKRIVYIKRLLNAYADGQPLKERLILNHLIVLLNVFGDRLPPMLFLKLAGHESAVKTFLSYLNRMPLIVADFGNPIQQLNNISISLDSVIWQRLSLL